MKKIGDVAKKAEELLGAPMSSEREEQNRFQNAVLEGRHGIKYEPGMTLDIDWGPIQREAKWWRGKYEDASVPAPSTATPEKIVAFFEWYKRENPTWTVATLPQTREKLVAQFANFELAKFKRGIAAKKAETASDEEVATWEQRYATLREQAQKRMGMTDEERRQYDLERVRSEARTRFPQRLEVGNNGE